MDFSFEKITLQSKAIISFNLLQHPHGGLLLSYLPNSGTNILILKKDISEDAKWVSEMDQNNSDFQQEVNQYGKIEAFTQCFDNKGDLTQFFNVKNAEGDYQLYLTSSFSYGKKWNPCRNITENFQSWKIASSPIILNTGMHAGQIVLAVEHTSLQRALAIFSKDNGKSWNFSLFIEPHDLVDNFHEKMEVTGTFAPNILESPTAKLYVYCKLIKTPSIAQSASSDLGATWSIPSPITITDFSDEGHFSVTSLNFEDVDASYVALLGTKQKEKKFSPSLWISTNEKKKFQ